MMCQSIKTVVLAMLIGSLSADDVFVNTPSGPIRGTTEDVEFEGREKAINAFLGIPYAEAPIRGLRFRPPVEVEPWENELDATEQSPGCYQETLYSHLRPGDYINSEDCLRVNIYVPKPRPANAAVLVYILEGSIYTWLPTVKWVYGQDFTALENLIVVTVNARSTVHGYLHLGIPETPGNMGLMDQQMALRWVRRNIASFGGNPDNVVITGTVDVGIQLLLPGSRDLFKRAMLDTVTPNAFWAMATKEEALESSKKLAEALGCGSDNPKEVLDCMQSVSSENLTDWRIIRDRELFVPTVDGTFISDDPMKLLSQENAKFVDVIIGSVHDTTLLGRLLPGISEYPRYNITEEEFLSGVDRFLKKHDNLNRKLIAALYTNWTREEDPSRWRDALEDLVDDSHFTCPTNEFIDLYLKKKSTVYRYIVDRRKFTITKDTDRIPIGLKNNDFALYRRMIRWFANFARTGNPNGVGQSGPTWEPSTLENKEYMHFITKPVMGVKYRTKECAIVKKMISVFEENEQATCNWSSSSHHIYSFDILLFISCVFCFSIF